VKRVSGFTLLEVLVALAVLAIAMGAIIRAATQSIATTADLREQTLAGWVALNTVNRWLLDAKPWPEEGTRSGDSELAARNWRWEARFAKTADPDLRRLDVTVRAASGAASTHRVAFRGTLPVESDNPADPADPANPDEAQDPRQRQRQKPSNPANRKQAAP
jgi:general secretion pathway protein I